MNSASSSSSAHSAPSKAPISNRGPLPPTPPRPMARVQTAPAVPIASGAVSLARTTQVAPALRDRNADIAHPAEPLASRKRKREEESLSPVEGGAESARRDAKQARHTLAGRELPQLPRPVPDQAAPQVAATALSQTEPTPLEVATTQAPTPSTVTSAPASASAPTAQAHAAQAIESDSDSDDSLAPMHGEYVSVYANTPAAIAGGTTQTDAEPTLGTLLYEQAVYTDHNGIIAISTQADRGVFAADIGAAIGVIFSHATGVGFMVIDQPESEGVQEDFMNARSEFIERTGSDQNIRIRIAHDASGFRRHLDALWTPEILQTIRTDLQLPPDISDAQIRETYTTLLLAKREIQLQTMAAQWGGVDPLINLPHGALHISQAGLDVFQAPPHYDLPAHLNELPPAAQD